MSPGQYIGIDVGTQGTKGLVIDAAAPEAGPIAEAAERYDLLPGLPEGAAEQHPETWSAAVDRVLRRLLAAPAVDPGRLAGLGVSGQQHGLVVLDEDHRVIRPAKLWCDVTTVEESAELSRLLGRRVPPGFTAPKVRWLARREPGSWARTRWVCLPHDFVNLRLTGRLVCEAGDASGTGWFDVRRRRPDPEAMAAVDPALADRVPPCIDSDEPAGRLAPEAAARTGLPEGLLVASGSGDNMMSAVGSGATVPGRVVVSLGTSGTAFAYAASPVVDPEGLVAAFCDATGGWLPLVCVMNLTGATEAVRRCVAPDADLDDLTSRAASVPAGSDGLLLLPYLAGERVPDLPEATGTLLGIRAGNLTPEHLFRAALEGTSLNLASGVHRLQRLGVAVDRVALVGGAAANPLWRQILADALGVPVEPLAVGQSAALGAALQALWCARRRRGEPVSADAVARPWIRAAAAPALPEPGTVALYAELRARLEDRTRRLHGPGA